MPWVATLLVDKGILVGHRLLDLMQPRDKHSTLTSYSSIRESRMARIDQSPCHAKLTISSCLSIDVHAIILLQIFLLIVYFQYADLSMQSYLYQAVAQGQSGILNLRIVYLYPLSVGLTSNQFDLTSPLLALRSGRGARTPNITEITMSS